MIRLSDHIAAAGGWLSLEAFMQLALHHPQKGYYSSSIENIGQRGDFSTTPTLSPILAKAIVAHWKEACSRCGRRLPLLEPPEYGLRDCGIFPTSARIPAPSAGRPR